MDTVDLALNYRPMLSLRLLEAYVSNVRDCLGWQQRGNRQ